MIIEFDGEESYENFGDWTDKVDLQAGEIKKIIIDYKRKDSL